jgi:hypothetical protein
MRAIHSKEATMAAAPLPTVPPSPLPGSPAASRPLSAGARIVNTFIAPSKTFTDLGAHARWWSWVAPWMVIVVVSTIFSYAVQEKVTFARAGENILQQRSKQYDRVQAMSPAERDKTMQAVERQTMIGTYAFPIIDLVILLLVAVVLFATFMFVANAKTSFKQVFALVAYASLPGAVRYLLATLTLFAGVSPDSFNLQNPVATNLGPLFSPTENPVLYAAASMIDIFGIWTLVLTAIGFTCISKAKIGTALTIVFGWYIAFMVVMVGLTAWAS